jgi:transposase InsO family protein
VDKQATERERTGPGVNVDAGRLNGSPGVTSFLKVTAHALQEWCTGSGTGTAYIPPGSPWENPFVESFNSRLRDEFLNIELFSSLPETKLLAEQHRIEYNVYRAHSALQGRTPLEFLQQWKAA